MLVGATGRAAIPCCNAAHLEGVDLLTLRLVHSLALQEFATDNAAVANGWFKDEQAVVHHEVAQHKAAT